MAIFAFATVIAIFWPRGWLLVYTIAAWIALSRVLIGVDYFRDVVLGAIFPYLVHDRFAGWRWLFE
jgi:membrane-associated phospholipid phosphatase